VVLVLTLKELQNGIASIEKNGTMNSHFYSKSWGTLFCKVVQGDMSQD
jgi:hypothetical protein